MAFLNICGAETGDGAETYNGSLSGGITVVTTAPRTGTYHFRAVATTTDVAGQSFRGLNGAGAPSDFGVATLYSCVHYRFVTLPAANDEEIFVVINDSASLANCWYVRITSSGLLKVYKGDYFGTPSLVATGSTALTTGTYYRLEFKFGVGASAAYEVKINGTSEVSGTQDFTGVTVNNYVIIGKAMNRNSQSVEYYFDDIAISDSAYPGAGQVNILKPDGAGSYSQFTGSYTDVDEVPHDSDTTYLEGSTSGSEKFHNVNLDSASTGGVSGSIGTVKGIGIARKTNANSHAGGIGVGTSIYANISAAITTSYATYAFMLDTNPLDSEAWESADLDALLLVAYLQSTNATTVRYTALYAMVWSTGQINTTVTPGAASLTLTAYTPSSVVGTKLTPGALSLTTTRYAPSVLTPVVAMPGALALTMTLYAPSVTIGLTVTPGALALALTAYTPTVINPQSATPGTLALALTAYEPGAVVNSIVTPGALTTALTAYAPAALLNNIVTPGALSASLTAYAPSAIVNFIVTPGAGSLAIATYGINIYLPGSAFGARQYWRSTQHKEYTKLVPYRDYRRATTYKDYIKSVKWVDRA